MNDIWHISVITSFHGKVSGAGGGGEEFILSYPRITYTLIHIIIGETWKTRNSQSDIHVRSAVLPPAALIQSKAA